jgi:two-component system chemotaxis response regulator CheY
MRKEILVIDGSRAIRLLINTILRRSYTVVAVPDGMLAMDHLRRGGNPDLVIASAELDDLRDWELIRHLCLSPLYHSIPILAISSRSAAELSTEGMKYNLAGCFSKPFDPLRLIAEVDCILLGSRMHRI